MALPQGGKGGYFFVAGSSLTRENEELAPLQGLIESIPFLAKPFSYQSC